MKNTLKTYKLNKLLTRINLITLLLIVIAIFSIKNLITADIEKIILRDKMSNTWFKLKPKIAMDYINIPKTCQHLGLGSAGQTEEFNNFIYEIKKNCSELVNDGKYSVSDYNFLTPSEYRPGLGGEFWDCADSRATNPPAQYLTYDCPISEENGKWFWIFGKKIIKMSD